MDESLGDPATSLDPTHASDLVLQGVEPLGGLARMGKTRLPLARLDRGDVDILGWLKLDGILAAGDLIIIKREGFIHLSPRAIDQERDGAMIGVVVDRPVREDDVGTLRLDDRSKRLVVLAIDHGASVDLAGEERPGL